MKKRILTILLIFAGIVSQAQINLVLNPGFEQYTHCPDELDEVKYCNDWNGLATIWMPPDWAHDPPGLPDYVNTCSSTIYAGVPNNYYFFDYAHSGNGMVIVQMYYIDSTVPDLRNYLQGSLSHSLVSGHAYTVNFYAILLQCSTFAVNHIGAYFDDGTIDTTHRTGQVQSQYTPQVQDTNIINDTLNWHEITDTFTAGGGEKYITIGNYYENYKTSHIAVPSTHPGVGWGYSAYLIDDVTVIDCANMPQAGNDTLIHSGDSAWLGPHETLLPYTWYKLGSTTPIDSGGGIWVKPTVSTSYVLEQNLCGVKKWDTVRVRVWPDTVTNVAMAQLLNGSIYPSPTKGLLTVEGVKGCTVCGYDVLGREVLSGIVATEKDVLNLEQLTKGVYMVVVTDRVTGFRVVRQVLKE